MSADLRPPRSVSVLIPTWQGAAFLERVLERLAAQEIGLPWDLSVVDSGSTDGTLAILERWRARFPVPFALRHIHQVEFDHGDTRNLLAALSEGDLLVFLTQDAIPVSERWLATLVRNFDDPSVAAASCRNLPRPDADPVTRVLSRDDPGYAAERREVRLPPREEYERMDPHARRLLYNFNDVASAIRRELWERHPFPRAGFGEDVLMARALLEAGWTVVHDAEAAVEHSHDHDEAETRARAEVDGRFNAEWLDRICIASESDARALAGRLRREDGERIAALGLGGGDALSARAHALRLAAFRGLLEGGRSPRRRAPSALLDRADLSILYVVHGFPPDTWAGTEVYTLNLAREMQRRGHRVTVFARAPEPVAEEEGGRPDFAVVEDELEGLRVLRMTHRLHHRNLAESYLHPEAEAAFRRVLNAERPDLVHFQHLIHASVGLVHVARELGLPTIVHCHDYWALCARVQMIRPDGERCERNMGAGCYLCVKERALSRIPIARRATPVLGPLAKLAHRVGRAGLLPDRVRHEAHELLQMRWRERAVLGAYAAADLRISPSRFLRSKLLETGAFDPHELVFSDNGMRTDHVTALEKRPDPEGRVRFGFVGSLVWYKGGETMVRAMARLRGLPVALFVHGDFRPESDRHHAELARLAAEADPGAVRFHGRFDNARLSDVYAGIDVLVVPSTWWENSPITIHEAFLTRTPVLASGIGGMAEYVRDGVDGLWFRPGDPADLAAKMRRFVDEPGLLGELSRDFPAVKTIEENARETEFRYRALVARSGRAGALVDYDGPATSDRAGPTEEQGRELLLLRPGGEARYDLGPAGTGRRRVSIELLSFAGERHVELAGDVFLGERPLGALGPLRGSDADELARFDFEVELAGGANGAAALRLVTRLRPAGPQPHLRIRRVRVTEAEA